MNTISVIIPTWNRANTLKRAVLSALNQTYPVTEVLICDDGSTDNSRQVILELNNEKVKWLEGSHAGMPSVPRNRGIKVSTGEWLAFLDSDDEWLPDKIEKQILAAEKLKTDAVCSNAFHITPIKTYDKLFLNYTKNIVTFYDLLKSNYIICSTSMIKRSLLPTVIGFPETKELKALEDYALWLRVSTQTDFAFVNSPYANYYDFPSLSVREGDTDVWEQRKRVFSDFILWIKNTQGMSKSIHYTLAKKEYNKALKMTTKGIFSFLFQGK